MKKERLLEWLNGFYERSIEILKKRAGERWEDLSRDAVSMHAKLKKQFPNMQNNPNEFGYEVLKAVSQLDLPREYKQMLVTRIILLGTSDTIEQVSKLAESSDVNMKIPEQVEEENEENEGQEFDCPLVHSNGPDHSRCGDGTEYRMPPAERWFAIG